MYMLLFCSITLNWQWNPRRRQCTAKNTMVCACGTRDQTSTSAARHASCFQASAMTNVGFQMRRRRRCTTFIWRIAWRKRHSVATMTFIIVRGINKLYNDKAQICVCVYACVKVWSRHPWEFGTVPWPHLGWTYAGSWRRTLLCQAESNNVWSSDE